MQNTLLTIAVAMILALVAALAAPFVVDWNDYRATVEREATRLTGIEVKVGGAIDARLLPSPRIVLHDVSVGGVPARMLAVELSLGALMRGEWRATELRIAAPRLDGALDRAGRLQWPASAAATARFDPDALTIERLHVEDGRAELTDAASGTRIVLDNIWFNGDARSLAGPLRGEGAASFDGAMYPYRLNAGRIGGDGTMRIKLNVDPVDRPLSIEADGEISMPQGVPRFSGMASFSRPVQLAGSRGAPAVSQPWRAGAKVTATPASVLLEQVEYHYGSQDQGVTLTGTADVKFGAHPHIEGVLSARQLDLDRALAPADGTRLPAAAALRMLAQSAGGAVPIPMQLGVGIDTVTLGGGTVLAVRGDIATNKDGWTLSGFEFRAPGSSRVQLAGRLTVQPEAAPAAVRFNGTASVDAADLQALVGWLDGRGAATPGPGRTLKARGDITIGSDAVAVERLTAQFGRETVEGRVSYVYAAPSRPARLDAALRASELDIDGARAFVEAALAGSTLERPKDVTLALDLGRATVGGVALRDLRARLTGSAAGLDIERLAVGDLGGAAVTVGGRIALTPAPHGNLTAELNARDLAGVATLLSQYAPPAAAPALARLTGPATLRGTLALDAAEAGGTAGTGKLSLDGTIGAVRVSLAGEASGDPAALDKASLRLDGRLDSETGPALVRLLALDRAVAVAPREPGRASFSIDGPLGGELRVSGQIAGGGLDATAAGTARLADGAVTAALRATVRRADLRPLSSAGVSVPVSVSGDLAVGPERVSLTEARGSVAGTNLSGKLSVSRAPPWRLDGDVEMDAIDATAAVTAVAGAPAMPQPAPGASWSWPVEPFAPGAAAGYQGRVAFRSQRAALTSALTVRELRGTLTLSPDGASFDDLAGDLGGGRLTARLALRRGERGLRAQGRIALADADAAAVLPAAARPPVTGRLGLDVEFDGTGLSPSALIGSLSGGGRLTLDAAQFAALDPHAFEALTRAADRGLAVDAVRVRDFMSRALAGGNLPLRHAEAGLQIASGQVRLHDPAVAVAAEGAAKGAAKGAALTVSGQLDLTQGTIDARLVLSGPPGESGGKPDLFMALRGPLGAPARTLDASALSGWLTLRAVELQARKLEAIEAAQRRQAVQEPAPPPRASEPPPASAPSPAPILAPPLPPPQVVPPAPAPKPQTRVQPLPSPLQILPQN